MTVADELRAFKVCSCPRHPPRPVETSRGKPFLFSPALERASRSPLEDRNEAKPLRFELRVEASLAIQLAGSRGKDPLPDGRGRLTPRLYGKLGKGHPTHSDLKVDTIQQRAG